MKVLGIDPGFANVGICVYDTESRKVDKFVFISTKKTKNPQVRDRIDRLDQMSEVFLNLMGDNDIKEISVEFLFRSPSVTGTATTSLCLGSILGLAKFFLLPVKSDTSVVMRKKVFGRTKVEDSLMYDVLSKQTNVKEALSSITKTNQPHCLDAYLCALWAAGETISLGENDTTSPIPTPKSGKSKNSGNKGVGRKNKKSSKRPSKNH